MSQSSFLSSNDSRLHFDLGAATTADIEIHWPMGASEAHTALPADQFVTLREGEAS
ncbi:MAG TPA: ASPIC/UnbV domain-containing protein [Candidatus Sulfotelmatobacter sp.]|nr:ASPIC/UnbV domain-containing protein [Candidatus Sulfotelmatobacter sp.]